MADAQAQAPRRTSFFKACLWAVILGLTLCIIITLAVFGPGAYETARLAAPECPAGTGPPAEAVLAFESWRAAKSDSNSDVYIIHADGSGQTRLTDSSDTLSAGEPVWSADGERLFFHSRAYETFFQMNADGSGLSAVSPAEAPAAYFGTSPDGRQRVAVQDGDILVMNADGSQRRVLISRVGDTTYNASNRMNSNPGWSPDGSRITFIRSYPSGSEDFNPRYDHLFSIRPDGSDMQDLSDSAYSYSWSPDGSRIAVLGTDYQLYVMKPDGTSRMRITNFLVSLDLFGVMAWSPDGEWLAFSASDSSSNSSLAISKSTCAGVHWLPDTSYSGNPAWRPRP